MKLQLSLDLSKCKIDKPSLLQFPKISILKKQFTKAGEITLNHFLLSEDLKNSSVSVLFTDDKYIHKLNLETRKKDKPTNVLSFPYSEFKNGKIVKLDNSCILGDMVFGVETCLNESKEQNKQLLDHLTHLYVHSLLHLIGFDHIKEIEANSMENIEVNILKKMDISNPYMYS